MAPPIAVVAGLATMEITPFVGLTALSVLAVVAAIVAVALLRHGGGAARLARRRLECPVERKPAAVTFVVEGKDGEAYLDVVNCSLRPPGEPVECGKVCRSVSVAPFSVADHAGT